MSGYMTLGTLLTKVQDLCDELSEGYRDLAQIGNFPFENLVQQLQGIENELDFMTRCFNDFKTGECVEINANERISLSIGRLMRDLEDLHTNMKNKNYNSLEPVYSRLAPAKGISGVAYRARDFYAHTKWLAVEAVKSSKRSLHIRYENITRSQGTRIKTPDLTKGLIKSRLTFASLSRERERYHGSSHSLPTLEDLPERDGNPRGLRQRVNSVISDLTAGQNIYDRAWEETGKRIRLARERITHSGGRVPADKL